MNLKLKPLAKKEGVSMSDNCDKEFENPIEEIVYYFQMMRKILRETN
jgi:hypothetical protein